MRGWWLLTLVGLAGCLEPATTVCGNGKTCPGGTVCDDAHGLCVAAEQLAQCAGQPDFATCVVTGIEDGRCYDEVCLPGGCGNERVDPDEACDDGNSAAGDGCAPDCQSDETCGNGRVDPVLQEQCDDGNAVSHDGCSSACDVETPRWVQVAASPDEREQPAMAYDAHRHRIVLFGGEYSDLGVLITVRYGDTWEWDGARWTPIAPMIAPSPRAGAAMAYDPIRARVVLFGGNDDGVFGDTWEWDGGTWTLKLPMGEAPPARHSHAMAWDPARRQVVVFGGTSMEGPRADTWAWDGATWTELDVGAPPARMLHAMTTDTARDEIVLFGGELEQGQPGVGDTWVLDADGWRDATPASGSPSGRSGHAMAPDPITGDALVMGGLLPRDTWRWNGTIWTQVATAQTEGLQASATDTDRGRVVLAGGRARGTFEWDGEAWTGLATSSRPGERLQHAAAPDVNGDVLVYGGYADAAFLADCWAWNGGGWTQLFADAPPGARGDAAMAYDSSRGITLLDGGTLTGIDPLVSTWLWDGATWTPAPAGPGRFGHTAVYDRARDEVVVFGGYDASTIASAQTWAWNGASWSLRTPATSPPARVYAAMAYDPVRARVVLNGGYSDELGPLSDTWEWDGTTWVEVTPTSSPPARMRAGMTWDAARGRVVMFGGQAGLNVARSDAWEWDGAAWLQVIAQSPPSGRSSHVVFAAPDGAGLLAFGGGAVFLGTPQQGRELWRMRWDGVSPSETCVDSDIDGDELVACDDPDCWAVCTPDCPPGTSCAP